MHRFFADIVGENNLVVLSEEESKHCKVLRISIGDEIEVIDGKGKLWKAEIIEINKRHYSVILKELLANERMLTDIILCVALPKKVARFEWLVEKVTEIGVTQIIPLMTKRTERNRINIERISKIIRSATKQSNRLVKPEILPLTTFSDVLKTEIETKMIAFCEEGLIAKKRIADILTNKTDSIILIGPEGDFTSEEIKLAMKNEFQPITLSQYRLRVETAAIVACTQIKENFDEY